MGGRTKFLDPGSFDLWSYEVLFIANTVNFIAKVGQSQVVIERIL